jgi:hypothetical protein
MILLCDDASAYFSAMLSAALGHAQLSGTRAFYTAEPLVHESGMTHCVYIICVTFASRASSRCSRTAVVLRLR